MQEEEPQLSLQAQRNTGTQTMFRTIALEEPQQTYQIKPWSEFFKPISFPFPSVQCSKKGTTICQR